MPYGYRPQHILISPHGRRPRHRVRLVVEPTEAFVVWTIFTWRVHDNLTCGQITDKLTSARYPAPLDPVTGQPGTWTTASMRSVPQNTKYTGWQIWGHHHGRPLQRADRVWPDTQAHPALIPTGLYDATQRPRRATIEPAAVEATPHGSGHRTHRGTS